MNLLPCGRRAILAEFDSADDRAAYVEALRARPIDGVVAMVPAARTVLVRVGDDTDSAAVAAALRDLAVVPVATVAGDTPPVTITATYDGEDLRAAAENVGWSTEALVRWHTGQLWTVDFVGFLPGFAYLRGDGPVLEFARQARPRPVVPAGSIGLAGPWCGIYPAASPGGWQLIGRTATPLWDEWRDPPALLTAGCRVRFVHHR